MSRVAGTGAAGASPKIQAAHKKARRAIARQQRDQRRAAAPPMSERSPATHVRPNDRAAIPKPLNASEIHALQVAKSVARLRTIHDKVIAEQSQVPQGVMKLLASTIANLAEDAIYSPAGIYGVGKGVYHDTGAAVHGDPSFDRTRRNVAEIGRQTWTGIKHPLRRPGDTLLLGLAAATAGASAAARGAAAGRALGESGTRAAFTRPGYEGGSLLHAPEPGSLTLTHGGLEVKTPAFRNPAARAVQKAYHRAHGNEVSAKYAGKSIAAERRVTEPLERAPAGELAARAKRLTVPQETALRVVAEGKPIADRIRFHEDRLAKAKTAAERRDQRQEILLLKAADRYVIVKDGKPVLRSEFRKPILGGGVRPRRGVGPAELQGTYGLMGKVAAEREKALAQVDRLTPEQIASRKQAPGRIIEGAKFEKPTPGKLGKSPKLDEVRAREARLQKAYDRSVAGASSKTLPKTVAQAETRLAELDKWYAAKVDEIAPGVNPYLNKAAETAARNRRRPIDKARNPMPTVNQEAAKIAEQRIAEYIAANPGSPSAKLIAERDRLTTALAQHAEKGTVFEGMTGSARTADNSHYFNQFGQSFKPDSADYADDYAKTSFRNIHDQNGNVIGSVVYDARPGKAKLYVESVFIRPESRSVTNFKRLIQPLIDDGRPIEAAFDNPRLQRLFEKAAGTRGISGQALPKDSVRTIERGQAPDDPLPQLRRSERPDLGRHRPDPTGMSSPRTTRLGGALSVTKDQRQRLEAATAKRTKPTGIVGAETFAGGDIRIPYTPSIPTTSRGVAAQYRGGNPRAPGSTTHEYTGALQMHANFRKRAAKLVAESGIEAQRYTSLLKLRDRVIQAAHDVPQKGDVPIRLDSFKKAPLPEAMKQIEAKLQEGAGLSREERKQIGSHYDELRLHIFPETPTEGVKWVNERLLNGLHQPGAPLAAAVGHVPVELWDAVNNASRFAILYLKPAYAVPNVAGNVFLNLVQQGAAAPRNIGRAVLATHQMGVDALARLDAIMGEGFLHAISGEQGIGHAAISKTAGVWSKGVDLPFRRSAFIFEARKAGYRTPARIRSLLLDEAHREKLIEVAQRANGEIIDYGRLSTKEREIVRRILFFYPWLKGSTIYGGRFLAEHPIKGAALGQLGQAGQKQAQKDLGDVPAFAEGLFKVGGTRDRPLTSNPASAAILGQPAQIAEAGLGLFQGHTPAARKVASFFVPAAGLAQAEFYRKDPFTGQDVQGNAGQVAAHQLTGGLPQVTLTKRLTGDQKDKLYPLTHKQSWEQFALGTGAPRTTNREKLNALAAKEGRTSMSPVERAADDGKKLRDKLIIGATNHGLLKPGQKQPPALEKALRLWTKRRVNLAERGIVQGKTDDYQHEAFKADTALLIKMGRITPELARKGLRWAVTATPKQIEDQRTAIGRQFFGTDVISGAKSEIHHRQEMAAQKAAHGG